MKIRVSNLSRVLYKKDHYENKGVKPASVFYIRTTMKIRVSNLPRVYI